MSSSAIFDTCILIDQIRNDKFRSRIPSVIGPIRISSVVLSELTRGAVTKTDTEILRVLAKNQKVLTPTEKNWIESGEILAKMRADHGFEPAKLRDLHFDVLIALTARSNGACLITSNRADFELILSYRDFELEIW
jgi:predicted nucleic acid-binding protein